MAKMDYVNVIKQIENKFKSYSKLIPKGKEINEAIGIIEKNIIKLNKKEKETSITYCSGMIGAEIEKIKSLLKPYSKLISKKYFEIIQGNLNLLLEYSEELKKSVIQL